MLGKDSITLQGAGEHNAQAAVEAQVRQNAAHALVMSGVMLTQACHGASRAGGWWTDLITGEPKERNVGELLCLIHSEISEAMEGHRKNLNDDKLPHRKMIEVELADALIRIYDLAGGLDLDVAGALVEKMQYNAHRADHKPENRLKDDGKKY